MALVIKNTLANVGNMRCWLNLDQEDLEGGTWQPTQSFWLGRISETVEPGEDLQSVGLQIVGQD